MITWNDIESAADRIEGVARRTPVMTSRTLDDRLGASVFLKCEGFQRGGAFKFRGAYNAISRLSPEERLRGVLTYSSGNHAQAVALVCRILGVKATVVMPSNAPRVKRSATEEYGATILTYDPDEDSREEIARGLLQSGGPVLVPPFDHPHIIAGQGTCAAELIHETGPLDLVLVPCGGGGLLSGSAVAAKHLSPGCRVIGVEPEAGDDAARSFRSGKIETAPNPRTIADGARTPSLGQITFPIVLRYVDDVMTVPDQALLEAMRFVWERMKIVVEPTGVLGLAAPLSGRLNVAGMRVGVIVSGGNVDVESVPGFFGRS